jgi:cobalt-zinc-cadmium efflux system membrane fusion protein
VEQAKAGIDSAQAQREQALARLQLLGVGPNDANPTIVVSSPLTGKVLELKVVAGEYHSDLGESVMTVVDLASVWMTSNVPESQIRWIERGEPVHITLDAFPGQRFQGRVERIADTLDPKTRTVKVMTALANPRGKFRPEMFGRIHHVHDAHKMTVVPATAILEGDDGHEVVYVETSPGSFMPREVELGVRKDSKVAILSGLSPGEKVVVDGALLLKK